MKKLLLPLGVLFVLPIIVSAQSCSWVCDDSAGSDVNYANILRLSEVLPNPEGDDTQYEFIEIENNSSKAVPLSGWVLEDATGRKFQIKEGSIPARGFLAIFRSVSKISLNNTDGDEVRLFDPSGKLQDELRYEEKAEEEFSFARNGSSWAWTSKPTPNTENEIVVPNDPPELEAVIPEDVFANKEAIFSAEGSSDPDDDSLTFVWSIAGEEKIGATVTHIFSESGEKQISVTVSDGRGGVITETYELMVNAYDLSDAISINELYPKPEDSEDEFIEVYNSGDRTVELSGWSVTDGSKQFVFTDHMIGAGEYVVLFRTESKIALNDTGDTVTLFKVDGTEVETISFGSAQKAKSYAKLDGAWQWADPTPGESNGQIEGVVLGAVTDGAELFGGPAEGVVLTNETKGFLEQYGVYLSGFLFAGAIGVSLYRRWKEQKALNDDFEE